MFRVTGGQGAEGYAGFIRLGLSAACVKAWLPSPLPGQPLRRAIAIFNTHLAIREYRPMQSTH